MSLLLVIAVLASATIPQALADALHACALVCPPPQVCAPVHGQNSYICTVRSCPSPRRRQLSADLPLRLTWLVYGLLIKRTSCCWTVQAAELLTALTGRSMALNLDCLSRTGCGGRVQPGVRQGPGVQAGEGLRPARLPRRSDDDCGRHARHAGTRGEHPRHDQYAGGRGLGAQQRERPVGCAPACLFAT